MKMGEILGRNCWASYDRGRGFPASRVSILRVNIIFTRWM